MLILNRQKAIQHRWDRFVVPQERLLEAREETRFKERLGGGEGARGGWKANARRHGGPWYCAKVHGASCRFWRDSRMYPSQRVLEIGDGVCWEGSKSFPNGPGQWREWEQLTAFPRVEGTSLGRERVGA